ncbi:hypothetical protein [Bradyrhizobium sp. G127]|uniref:hypothetical protein n=1 Tax=Bradyrhizobium sp. G127 TaxID=2904800 RepID=UPI001F16CA1A|nr:hypothetical protein [Bradyrhizobium sp. G127]MCF2525183.1 hypothetical protein [Bradyrhizobium sp. G127]
MHPRTMIVQGVAATALTALMFSAEARAQAAPDTDNGRFTLSPVADGFLRLDTRTGTVSTCANKNGWTCRVVPDERTALDAEIGRLQIDNKRLTDELARRDTVSGKTEAPLAKEDSKKSAQATPEGKASPDKKVELQLPPEHEKLLALMDRVWDRLIEMALRLQKRLSEGI